MLIWNSFLKLCRQFSSRWRDHCRLRGGNWVVAQGGAANVVVGRSLYTVNTWGRGGWEISCEQFVQSIQSNVSAALTFSCISRLLLRNLAYHGRIYWKIIYIQLFPYIDTRHERQISREIEIKTLILVCYFVLRTGASAYCSTRCACQVKAVMVACHRHIKSSPCCLLIVIQQQFHTSQNPCVSVAVLILHESEV